MFPKVPLTRPRPLLEPLDLSPMDWFRSYHGAPLDPKFRYIADRVQCPMAFVTALWWALLDAASQNDETRGNACNADVTVICFMLGIDPSIGEKIVAEMRTRKLLIGEWDIAKWEKRQPKREDSSTERVRRFRETQRNAVKRTETLEESREEERRVDSNAIAAIEPFSAKPNAIRARGNGLKKIEIVNGEVSVTGIYADQHSRDMYAVQAIAPHLPGKDDGERWAIAIAAETPADPNHAKSVRLMLATAKRLGVGWVSPQRRKA